MRAILDGHIVLDRRLAEQGRFPAIDPLASVSRVMSRVAGQPHREAAARVRALLAALEQSRDLVRLGAYQPGSDPLIDRALERREALEAFLRQDPAEFEPFEVTLARLEALA